MKYKRNFFLILIIVLLIFSSCKISQSIQIRNTKQENTMISFQRLVIYFGMMHKSFNNLIINDSIDLNALESIKQNINSIISVTSIEYDWCKETFLDDRESEIYDGDFLKFFIDLNSFFNENPSWDFVGSRAWYNQDGILSSEEKDYLSESIEIFNKMYENCMQLNDKWHSSEGTNKVSIQDFRNAIWEPFQ